MLVECYIPRCVIFPDKTVFLFLSTENAENEYFNQR